MKQPYRHRVNHREFLNLPGFHEGAYVVACVEDTSERGIESVGEHTYNLHPRLIVEIADCTNRIDLEFEIDSAHRRQNSFHKVKTLIDALEAFKAGMAEECTLYKERDRELSSARNASSSRSKRPSRISWSSAQQRV
jgi:hypothetical protein